jgi:hypothetical protein
MALYIFRDQQGNPLVFTLSEGQTQDYPFFAAQDRGPSIGDPMPYPSNADFSLTVQNLPKIKHPNGQVEYTVRIGNAQNFPVSFQLAVGDFN